VPLFSPHISSGVSTSEDISFRIWNDLLSWSVSEDIAIDNNRMTFCLRIFVVSGEARGRLTTGFGYPALGSGYPTQWIDNRQLTRPIK
jgi:hypothetical protein